MSVHTIGFELGYQFIFWDRMTLDMVLLGPGISTYKLTSSIGSNLSSADREKLLEALNEALIEKFPGYERIIESPDFEKSGSSNTTGFGYRYMIQIGFRF
jgi:hypothetical protein